MSMLACWPNVLQMFSQFLSVSCGTWLLNKVKMFRMPWRLALKLDAPKLVSFMPWCKYLVHLDVLPMGNAVNKFILSDRFLHCVISEWRKIMLPHDALYMGDNFIYWSWLSFSIYEAHFFSFLNYVIGTRPVIAWLPSKIRIKSIIIDYCSPY